MDTLIALLFLLEPTGFCCSCDSKCNLIVSRCFCYHEINHLVSIFMCLSMHSIGIIV